MIDRLVFTARAEFAACAQGLLVREDWVPKPIVELWEKKENIPHIHTVNGLWLWVLALARSSLALAHPRPKDATNAGSGSAVNFRPLGSICDKNKGQFAWAPLSQAYRKKINLKPEQYEEFVLKTHAEFSKGHYGNVSESLPASPQSVVCADKNCCNLCSSVFKCCRCCRGADTVDVICSEFVTIVLERLGIMSTEISTRDVVPMEYVFFAPSSSPGPTYSPVSVITASLVLSKTRRASHLISSTKRTSSGSQSLLPRRPLLARAPQHHHSPHRPLPVPPL